MTRLACLALTLTFTSACSEPEAAPVVDVTPRPEEPQSDEPRPSTQQAISCDGASVDPPQLALVLGEHTDPAARVTALEALAGANPGSATTRTRLGEQLLRTRPPSVERAQTWFDRALALHEQGCTLGERDHWATLEGASLSRMMAGDYASALPLLIRSLTRWPSARATRYNLACVRCQTDALDECADALQRVLEAGPDSEPAFLSGERRTREHYVQMAEGDPDLAPLRADPPRFSSVLGGR